MIRPSPLPLAPRPPRYRGLILGLLLVVMAAGLFAPAVRYGFLIMDDNEYVTENPAVRAGLNPRGVVWAFTAMASSNWHPLTWLSHMLDVSLFGFSPAGHHLVSILWHAAAALLLFLALRAYTGSLFGSISVAALFAVHPLRVESVVWVAERKDVLAAFLWMLILLVYLGYVRRPSTGRYLAVAAAFALGLMAKPMLVTMPVLLLLLDWWPLARLQRAPGRRLLEKLPLALLAAASAAITYQAQKTGGALKPVLDLPFGVRFQNALFSTVSYIGKLLLPRRLAVFYPHPGASLPAWKSLGAALVIITVTVTVVLLRRRRPYLLAGWLWYLVTLLPVIGLVQVGKQGMADRYTYLTTIGLLVMAVWGLTDMTSSWRQRALPLALATGLILAALMMAAHVQLGFWRDDEALFTRALAVTENNWLAHNNLGLVLAGQGKTREEIQHYREALKIEPYFPEALNNLGAALTDAGEYDEAAKSFKEALRINPRLESPHSNLGVLYLRQGKPEYAIYHFRLALAIQPDKAAIHLNLGQAYAALGKTAEALEEYRRTLSLDPGSDEARRQLREALSGRRP